MFMSWMHENVASETSACVKCSSSIQQHRSSEAISEQKESLWLAVAVCILGFALLAYEQITTSCSFVIVDDSLLTCSKIFVNI